MPADNGNAYCTRRDWQKHMLCGAATGGRRLFPSDSGAEAVRVDSRLDNEMIDVGRDTVAVGRSVE